MWGNVISILERRWAESRQPKKRLAKAMMSLYSSMSTCHQAFLNYRDSQTEENLMLWGQSIDSLILTLRNVQPVLEIFHPETYDHLFQYLRDESRAASLFCGSQGIAELGMSALQRQFEEEAKASNTDFGFPSDYDIRSDDGEDFRGAINKLGEIMKKEFKIEEIFEHL